MGLDGDDLKIAAQRRTGLTDFGPWPIDSALDRLTTSYRREAQLSALGAVTARETLVSSLANLLTLTAERQQCPAIENLSIGTPVFVIGLPRTGTTLLHGLLAQDPNNRAPLSWEVMYPGSYRGAPQAAQQARQRAAKRLGWANRLAPAFKRIHPIDADLPQECIAITAHVLQSIQFHTTNDLPSYQNWLQTNDQTAAYGFHKQLVQHLEYGSPGRRWVFKAPGHLFALAELLHQYPDARIIQTHRNPLQVVASLASHTTVLRRAFSDAVDPHGVGQDWTARWALALDRFLAIRDQQPGDNFLDINYDAIETRPLDTIKDIYAWLGWTFTAPAEQAMQQFLAANPKNKHGAHRYSLEAYGLDVATEQDRFAAYGKRFNIPTQLSN